MAGKNIPNESKFDTRTINHNIRDGRINDSDYQKYLKSLPDDSDNATQLEIEEGPAADEPTPCAEPTFTA